MVWFIAKLPKCLCYILFRERHQQFRTCSLEAIIHSHIQRPVLFIADTTSRVVYLH